MTDSDEYKPRAFTAEQRELFNRARALNRGGASEFAEAEDWIATPPESAEQELRRYRAQILAEAAARRKKQDRSWMVSPSGEMADDWRKLPEGETKNEVLARWRTQRARTIRGAIARFREDVREELDRGPLQPYQLLDLKAGALTGDERPAFDGLTPEQKVLWARRVLRVAWIMTDTAPLVSANREWLRQWEWGEHALQFLAALPDGKAKLIPRVYARVSILDDELETWEELVRDALRAVDEAAEEPSSPSPPPPLPPPPAPALARPSPPPAPPPPAEWSEVLSKRDLARRLKTSPEKLPALLRSFGVAIDERGRQSFRIRLDQLDDSMRRIWNETAHLTEPMDGRG